MHRELFFHGQIEPETTALLRRSASVGWTFFDVGANEGYYALLAMDLGGPTARVVAFEPQPQVAALLRASVALNDYPIQVVEAACASTGGTIDFYPSDQADNSGAASAVAGLHSTTRTSVRAVTLDEFCATSGLSPDVMKVDVEGFEFEVLRGCQETLIEKPPRLIVAELSEDPRHPTHQNVAPYLDQFGYVPHRIARNGSLLPFDAPKGLENVAFVHQGALIRSEGERVRGNAWRRQ